jgi:U6 snRNA-associated Sm-like protein LSm8
VEALFATAHRRCLWLHIVVLYVGSSNNNIEKVLIMTADSRTLVGNLLSCDQQTNLVRICLVSQMASVQRANTFELQVLGQAIERVIRTPDDEEASTEVPLGLYIVRGDNVCVVGVVDQALDDSINWEQVKGSAFGGIKHT